MRGKDRLMGRRAKHKQSKAEAKRPVARKTPRAPGGKLRDLERRLAEAQEQQTATAEILRVISGSPTAIQPVLDAVAENAARLCEAHDAIIWLRDGDALVAAAHRGPIMVKLAGRRPISRDWVTGRAVADRQTVHIHDLTTAGAEFPMGRTDALQAGHRTIVAVPLLREDHAIGVITIRRIEVRPFTDKQIALLQTFADQAVIAIENVRLVTELKTSNRDLTTALDKQTATSDILRVISRSQTDVQPVFDAIVHSAVQLLRAHSGMLTRVAGNWLELAAFTSIDGAYDAAMRTFWPRPLDSKGPHTQAIRERAPINIADAEVDPRVPEAGRAVVRLVGLRSVASVPLLRHNEAIGTVAVNRQEASGFTTDEIALLQTFADQAVIAIENVRLFTELQTSNRELTTALDTQTATADILRVISGSRTDVQPVFDTIVQSAARLCNAANAAVFLTDGQMVYHPANYGSASEALATVRALFPRPLDMSTPPGIAILTRSVVQVPDIEDPSAIEAVRQGGRVLGFRSVVMVPMLRESEPVGALGVARREPGQFSDAEVGLLTTFADQAVIAIENVRLFKELESANRELAAASQHKSEFLANMSHELRTPLNAIIGFSEVLGDRMFGDLNDKQEEYLKDINASGQHLLSLINDILDLSKIEAGRMELELADFDLPAAIENALSLVRERAGRRGIRLTQQIAAEVGTIRADERKMKQVMLNLLSNAIKFSPEDGRIEVRAAMTDGIAEISVTDTGVGIAPEDQQAIFEEFRQVGTADKKAEGTGLGLALSRKFIELHGGKIWVKSELGQGSTFTFTLPVQRGDGAPPLQ
jgi:signal transduction histidine kinase